MPKIRTKYIQIPIFNQTIFVQPFSYAVEVLGDACLAYDAVCFKDHVGSLCISLDEEAITRGLLVHESVHLANNVLEGCLVPATQQEDEALAYLTAFIFEKLERMFFRNVK